MFEHRPSFILPAAYTPRAVVFVHTFSRGGTTLPKGRVYTLLYYYPPFLHPPLFRPYTLCTILYYIYIYIYIYKREGREGREGILKSLGKYMKRGKVRE